MPLDNPNEAFENVIPAAVRRASKRADEKARELGAANVPEEPPADPPTDPATPPAETPPADPPADPATPPAPPSVEPATDWEARYRSLQGKYDAEIPQLRNELSSMRQLIANMEHKPPAPAAEPSRTTTTVVEIPKEEVEAYGEDLIAASQRWAAAKFQPEIEALRNEIAQLRGGQQQMTVDTAHERVHAGLDRDPELANWRQINSDPEFISWLNQVDPFSGAARVALLGQAYANGDAARCGRFFKSFIAEHTATHQPPVSTPTDTPPVGAERPTLESLAAPGRAAGTGPHGGAPAEKRVWTRADITAFYRDCSAGKYAHREADRGRIEADIFAAQSEGRIR